MFKIKKFEGGAVVCPEKLGIIYLSFLVQASSSVCLGSYIVFEYETFNSVSVLFLNFRWQVMF